MNIRAFYRAAIVENAKPPYNTIHLKVYYRGQISGDDQEQNQGIVSADPQLSNAPVVILFNGVNCNPEVYQWLAVSLAERGLVVITFAWVAENFPGVHGIQARASWPRFCKTIRMGGFRVS